MFFYLIKGALPDSPVFRGNVGLSQRNIGFVICFGVVKKYDFTKPSLGNSSGNIFITKQNCSLVRYGLKDEKQLSMVH